LATNHHSLLDLDGERSSVLREAFGQAVAFTLAGFHAAGLERSVRVTPAWFAAVPVGASAIAVAALGNRVRGLSAQARLLWGAASGLMFALAMMISALVAGKFSLVSAHGVVNAAEPSLSGVFLLGLLWGAIGGALGMRYRMRRDVAQPQPDLVTVSPSLVRLAVAALRPLVLTLIVAGLLGSGVWVVQTLRNVGSDNGGGVRAGRSTLHSTIENTLFGVEHAVGFTELAAGVTFESPGALGALGMPLPVDQPERVTQQLTADGRQLGGGTDEHSGRYRIFDYRHATAEWAFILLLALIAIPAFMAVYAGFSLARARESKTAGQAAGYGALAGPVWALTMLLIDALARKDLFGRADPDSVFASFLLGALGGLLASEPRTHDQTSTAEESARG
jgi:hypothetical protein